MARVRSASGDARRRGRRDERGRVARRGFLYGRDQQAQFALDERPRGVGVQALLRVQAPVRRGVDPVTHVADDLRQGRRLFHQTLVLLQGGHAQRAPHFGKLRWMEGGLDGGPQQRRDLPQLIRGDRARRAAERVHARAARTPETTAGAPPRRLVRSLRVRRFESFDNWRRLSERQIRCHHAG